MTKLEFAPGWAWPCRKTASRSSSPPPAKRLSIFTKISTPASPWCSWMSSCREWMVPELYKRCRRSIPRCVAVFSMNAMFTARRNCWPWAPRAFSSSCPRFPSSFNRCGCSSPTYEAEIALQTTPGPALELRGEERRACVRYLCQLDGSCQPVGQPTTGESWLGKLRDISATGVKLMVNRRFELGTLLVLDLPHAGWEASRMLLCRVVRVSKEPLGSDWEVGCTLAHELSHDEVQSFLEFP